MFKRLLCWAYFRGSLFSEGLIIGRNFASEIWGGGAYFGGAYYRNFTVPNNAIDDNIKNIFTAIIVYSEVIMRRLQ